MNGSLPRNYGYFSQAARFRHFASRMRSILDIRDKPELAELISAGICDWRNVHGSNFEPLMSALGH
jgi:hypothetical protein